MAPASGTLALMQSETGGLIRNHLAAHCPGCRGRSNPGVVARVGSENNFRASDTGVACTPIPRGVIEVAEPVLLIEILYPGNSMPTWTNVWACTNIQSVQKILVTRTASTGIQLLRRAPGGNWPDIPGGIKAGELEVQNINFARRLLRCIPALG